MYRALRKLWGPRICAAIPLELWHRITGIELLLPYYHVVSDHGLAHVSPLYNFRSLSQFRADLEFLTRHYVPIDLRQVISFLDGAGQLPKRCFLVSFDDGFREIYDIVAPLLYEKGIPAVFFLTTSSIDNVTLADPQKKSLLISSLSLLSHSSIEQKIKQILTRGGIGGPDLQACVRGITFRDRHVLQELGPVLGCDFVAYASSVQPYLTSNQIRTLMKMGFAIGAHSVDHPLYSELNLDEQLDQTYGSIDFLSRHFKYACQAFAFPFMDNGISKEYFDKLYSTTSIKVSFGTGGMHNHFFRRNLERFSMEHTNNSARLILCRQFAKKLLN